MRAYEAWTGHHTTQIVSTHGAPPGPRSVMDTLTKVQSTTPRQLAMLRRSPSCESTRYRRYPRGRLFESEDQNIRVLCNSAQNRIRSVG